MQMRESPSDEFRQWAEEAFIRAGCLDTVREAISPTQYEALLNHIAARIAWGWSQGYEDANRKLEALLA